MSMTVLKVIGSQFPEQTNKGVCLYDTVLRNIEQYTLRKTTVVYGTNKI